MCNARQDDWDECLTPYELACNTSVNSSLGETPFFLNHGRHPTLPVAIVHKLPSPAVEEFAQHLQNSILEARDHLCRAQESRAQCLEQGMRPSKLKVGDLVLLSTEHYNVGPSHEAPPPELVEGEKEFEVEDILSH